MPETAGMAGVEEEAILGSIVSVLAALVALAALWRARRLARRVETLQQAYWELRYEYTELRARVARLDPDRPDDTAAGTPGPETSFVPISTLKKS